MVLIENFGVSEDIDASADSGKEVVAKLHTNIAGDNDGGEGGMEKWRKTNQGAFTKGMFCMGDEGARKGRGVRKRRKGDVSFMPDKDQMTSEMSRYNPLYIIFPILKLLIDLVFDIVDIFFWLAGIIFGATYDVLVPNAINLGFKKGKKFCMNMFVFRILITVLCPPAGVFMAYGFYGFLQIIICAVLSLFFYLPGLVYAFVVIMRSDVAEAYEQYALGGICDDDGSTTIFMEGEGDEKPKCSRTLGEKCTPGGAPLPDNPMKKDCCVQPEYVDGEWKVFVNGQYKTASNPKGNPITEKSEGELRCAQDTTYLEPGGICVWKSTGTTDGVFSTE